MTGQASTFAFNNPATCTSSGGRFFCVGSVSSPDNGAWNGCDDVTFANSYIYSTTSFPSPTYQLSYAYSTFSYSCSWDTYYTESVCSTGYETYTYTIPSTATEYSYHTDTVPLTSQYEYSFSTTIYLVTNAVYTSSTYVTTTTTTTKIYTGYSLVPINYDTLKLSWYALQHLHSHY